MLESEQQILIIDELLHHAHGCRGRQTKGAAQHLSPQQLPLKRHWRLGEFRLRLVDVHQLGIKEADLQLATGRRPEDCRML